MRIRKFMAATTAVAAAGLIMAACGSSDDGDTNSTSEKPTSPTSSSQLSTTSDEDTGRDADSADATYSVGEHATVTVTDDLDDWDIVETEGHGNPVLGFILADSNQTFAEADDAADPVAEALMLSTLDPNSAPLIPEPAADVNLFGVSQEPVTDEDMVMFTDVFGITADPSSDWWFGQIAANQAQFDLAVQRVGDVVIIVQAIQYGDDDPSAIDLFDRFRNNDGIDVTVTE